MLDPALDALLRSTAVDDGCGVLVHRNALRPAQILQRDALQLNAGFFHNGLAASQDRNIFQHCLAAVAEARGLHGTDIERSAQFVHHKRGQRFAVDFLGDHQQRLAGTSNLFEKGQQILHVADLLIVNEDVGIL